MKTKLWMTTLMLMASAVVANAQEHQTYSGTFGKGDGGTATYFYYESEDGQRVFEGKYTFKKTIKRSGENSIYTEDGQYKNDKLEGLWTFTFNISRSWEKVVGKVTANYKNGLLDGPMHFSRKITEDGKTKTDVYDFQFKEGYLTGKATNLKIGDWIFTYQCDENAIPVGIWKKKPDRKGLNWVECAVYTDGKIIKSYSEVPSTGDRTETSAFVFPSDLLDGIRKLLEYPGDMKEQPIRSSVNEIKSKISPRYDEALKYGLIGVRGYVY